MSATARHGSCQRQELSLPGRFFPEILPLLAPSAAGHGMRGPLIGHAVSVLGFNLLQLYWLWLTLSYTLKNGVGGERPD